MEMPPFELAPSTPLLEVVPPYEPMPKIKRLNRQIIISEKIDGTNAAVYVSPGGLVRAGSKKRWISTEGKHTDNYGFAAWVRQYAEELKRLGPGLHRGEWFGHGINRGYGMPDRRFALFNMGRWYDPIQLALGHGLRNLKARCECPPCCTVVPILGMSTRFNSGLIQECLDNLFTSGSVMVPGWRGRGPKGPEGVVVFHTALGTPLKVTLENDDKPKGTQESDE